jgi:hypothetical protein
MPPISPPCLMLQTAHKNRHLLIPVPSWHLLQVPQFLPRQHYTHLLTILMTHLMTTQPQSVMLVKYIPASNPPAPQLLMNPLLNTRANGIDSIYMQEARQLTCHVTFIQIPVNTAAESTSRISVADVQAVETGAYVSAWLHYNVILHEVVSIEGNVATCKNVDDEAEADIDLPPLRFVHKHLVDQIK